MVLEQRNTKIHADARFENLSALTLFKLMYEDYLSKQSAK